MCSPVRTRRAPPWARTRPGAATDDAGLVEAIGGSVQTVAGDELSLKVTRPLDLAIARLLADQEQAD